MLRNMVRLTLYLSLICCVLQVHAEQPAASGIVPPVVKFGGVLTDASGKPVTGTAGVTFALYKDQEGGAPLWMETQNVQPDKTGHYSVMLGATSSHGLAGDLFVSGEPRWLGVQLQGQAEQPRTVLMSVPYALKAADAETIGGLPPSAFVKASATSSTTGSNVSQPSSAITGTGTTNHVTKWQSRYRHDEPRCHPRCQWHGRDSKQRDGRRQSRRWTGHRYFLQFWRYRGVRQRRFQWR
jgi:hypothetical protein